jgi:hypothetical protein
MCKTRRFSPMLESWPLHQEGHIWLALSSHSTSMRATFGSLIPHLLLQSSFSGQLFRPHLPFDPGPMARVVCRELHERADRARLHFAPASLRLLNSDPRHPRTISHLFFVRPIFIFFSFGFRFNNLTNFKHHHHHHRSPSPDHRLGDAHRSDDAALREHRGRRPGSSSPECCADVFAPPCRHE